jgi:glutamyl-tRNA reductase
MSIFVAGLSFKTAPVEVREQLAGASSKRGCQACRLKLLGGLDEVVLLSTCNRVEVYGVADKVNGNIPPLFDLLANRPCAVSDYLYVYEGAAALQHLFKVSAGLESMVLGETEITGQVKQAYESAQSARLTGPVLNRSFQKALNAAKEVRTQTGIQRGATSVGSVAVELAEKIFRHSLAHKTVMILGAGQMAEACLRHMAKTGTKSILVSNRSFDRAQELAAEFGGQAIRFDGFLEAMTQADILIASTGCPRTLLHRSDVEKVMQARQHRPLFLIDISVPRNIEASVQQLENVYLYNIDNLELIVRENVQIREQELTLCREIVERKAGALMQKLRIQERQQASSQEPEQANWLPVETAFVR